MLNTKGALIRAVGEITAMIVYGAAGLIFISAEKSQSLTPLDIRMSILVSFSFMVLSGFFLTIIGTSSFDIIRKSVFARLATYLILFLFHVLFFLTIFGQEISISDARFIVVGMIAVTLAVLTALLVTIRAGRSVAK